MSSGFFMRGGGCPPILFRSPYTVIGFLESQGDFYRACRANACLFLKCTYRTAPGDTIEYLTFLAHALIICRAPAAHAVIFLFSDNFCPPCRVHRSTVLLEFFKSVHVLPPPLLWNKYIIKNRDILMHARTHGRTKVRHPHHPPHHQRAM